MARPASRDETYFAQWERSPFADAYSADSPRRSCSRCNSASTTAPTCWRSASRAPIWSAMRSARAATKSRTCTRTWIKTIGHAVRSARRDRRQGSVGRRAQRRPRRDADSRAARRRRQGRRADQRRRARSTRSRQVLKPALGEGRHVTVLNTNDIYFEPGVYDKILKSRQLTDVAWSPRSRRSPGIQRVFRSEELRGGAKSKDPLLRAAALSYFPGRSGDLVFATKPGWMISAVRHDARIGDRRRSARADAVLGRGVKPGTLSGAGDAGRSDADAGRASSGLCDEGGRPSAVVRAVKRGVVADPFSPSRAVGGAAHSAGARRVVRRGREAGRTSPRGARRRQHHEGLRPSRRALPPRDRRRRPPGRLRRQRGR